MNKKGFTLIELLMVIVLIGIIALIFTPNIMTMINKNNTKSCDNFKNNIVSSAKMYVAENKYNMEFTCEANSKSRTLQELVEGGYLKEPVINPITKETVDLNSKVNITFDCSTKKFTYEFDFDCKK